MLGACIFSLACNHGERERMEGWDYEDVSVQTPEGKVIDLMEGLLKGKATGKRIVIDVAPPRGETGGIDLEEERVEYSNK